MRNAQGRTILEAARQAFEVRRSLNVAPDDAISPIDAAHKLGIQVWLRDAKSYDGAYLPGGPPIIVLSSLRPVGRMNYTCAHEIGHHIFGHSMRLEEVFLGGSRSSSIEELLADAFAAHFLLPRRAVLFALRARGMVAASLGPRDVLGIASSFGVGYSTLVEHMASLGMIQYPLREVLLRNQPAKIKRELTGLDGGTYDLFLVDTCWGSRTLDCRVGDRIAPSSATALAHTDDGHLVPHGDSFEAIRSGRTDIVVGSCRVRVRIARRGGTARAVHMFEEDE